MELIVCVLFIMLLWNLIKMVKSITEANKRVVRNDKHHKARNRR